MIDIVRIIEECSTSVESKVYVKTHVENYMLHIEFQWAGFEKRNILTRLYTFNMIEDYQGDLSECIIDDFKRHANWEPLK